MGGSPSGLVFHLLCTHSHCSGYLATQPSITWVNRAVLATASASSSPLRTSLSAGSKQILYLPRCLSHTPKAGSTAASVCKATRARPVAVQAGTPKNSTKAAFGGG